MTLRALIIVPTDHPGGAERIAAAVGSELSENRGWALDYLVLSDKCDPSFSEPNLPRHANVRFLRGEQPKIGMIKVLPRLSSGSWDLVFTTHAVLNGYVSLLRGLHILKARRHIARESTTMFDRLSGAKAVLGRLVYAIYSADLVVAQTRYMAEHVKAALPVPVRQRVCTHPNPINFVVAEKLSLASSPYAEQLAKTENILFCGRLIDVKRPFAALHAYVQAMENFSPDARLRLVFMGEGPLESELKEEARRIGLGQEQVLFLGRQENPYAIMRQCRYGILTSVREGFPNVLLEMMASGVRKLIVTPCAGDLDTLPGVTITENFEIGRIAEALTCAIRRREDWRGEYRKHARSRSVTRFVGRMLSEVGL